jgi:hypothetical protein
MKFFFPDSQDLVDPSFDFAEETRSDRRIRHQDDHYAHEVFKCPPYDGILVSKAMIDGTGSSGGRYTLAQRQRFYRVGVRQFFRLAECPLETMGDCGAFAYVREERPPVSVDEVAGFYEDCGFDYGISVDHIILAYKPELDECLPELDVVPEDWRRRQEITLELAQQFYKRHRKAKYRFTPIGVAQGWSPSSYANAVRSLQAMDYRYVAMGGFVPMKSHEIIETLAKVDEVRRRDVRLHLLGVTRCEHVPQFADFGVASFDSTSPLRQAFKEDVDNYYTLNRTYTALRVPQVEGNARMRRRIVAGEIDQAEARRLERACLDALKRFDQRKLSLRSTLAALRAYEDFYDGQRNHTDAYREILEDRPWTKCPCDICRSIGIHVVIFRGAERNRRRGFHNVYVAYKRLHRALKSVKTRGAVACKEEL